MLLLVWLWLKNKQEGQTAGFGPCFHLPIGQPILEFRFFEPRPFAFMLFGGLYIVNDANSLNSLSSPTSLSYYATEIGQTAGRSKW